MSQEWIEFLAKIKQKLSELADDGCDYPVFRGQGNSTWSLTPSLLRLKDKDPSIGFKLYQSVLVMHITKIVKQAVNHSIHLDSLSFKKS